MLITPDHFPRLKGPLSFHSIHDRIGQETVIENLGRKTQADGQNTRMMIGWKYPSITEIAADERIALNLHKIRGKIIKLEEPGCSPL